MIVNNLLTSKKILLNIIKFGGNMSIGKNSNAEEYMRAKLESGDFAIHFIGVGGVGMVSLFALCEHLGFAVSGSDIRQNEYTEYLISQGKHVTIGNSAENVKGADIVVYTLALSPSDPELSYAVENNIPVLSRPELLGVLMMLYKKRIGVSGTHGKSTSTAMLASIYKTAGRQPTVLCGASIDHGMPYVINGGEELIYEACEYKDAFMKFSPTDALLTNLELDHVDYFKDAEALERSFAAAMRYADTCVLNSDDSRLVSLVHMLTGRVITYGEGSEADFRITDIDSQNGYYSFKISHGGTLSNRIKLFVPGRFNVYNAAGAFALAFSDGVSSEDCEKGLSCYHGIGRRLELLGKLDGIYVYYDYAHHPTEIEASIKAVIEIHGVDVGVIFRPHTYSRTAGLFDGFVRSLSIAERVFLLDISAVREVYTDAVSSQLLAESIGNKAQCIEGSSLTETVKNSGMRAMIIMGAADIDINDIKDKCK